MIQFFTVFSFFLTFLFIGQLKSGYIDNRNLPLWSFPFHLTKDKPSAFQVRAFAITANKAYDYFGNGSNDYGKDYSLCDLEGRYNLARVAKQLELAGYKNPLQDDLRTLDSIPFDSKGKIQAHGLWFGWFLCPNEYSFLGIDFAVLNASSSRRYKLKRSYRLAFGNNVSDALTWQLYRDRQEVSLELDLCGDQYSITGVSDLDFYLGLQNRFEYCLKLRSLNLEARVGTLIPVSYKDNVFEPAAISLTGEGKYGIYGRIDITAELCEDWNLYFWTEVLGRTPRCQNFRMLVDTKDFKNNFAIGVPQGYAPLIGEFIVKPGLTFGLGFWADFAYLRDGWGVNGGYTLIHHEQDNWQLNCQDKPQYKSSFYQYERLTTWDAEWFTVGLFHNPMLTQEGWCRYLPVFYFDWSIPVKMLIAKNAPKTNRISLGLEYNF
jgi:hypothetical protein